jgi:hypothetical protein
MNPNVAYAIAAAVEKKTGLFIMLQTNNEIYLWMVDDVGFAVLKTTDMSPQHTAQLCLDTFRHLIGKPTKKRRDDD